jgi:hypothetical protein
MINWIENWYKSQCNDDWEHNFGVKITTIDNPGWEITIDLNSTNLSSLSFPWTLVGDFESSWVGYKIENNQFNGASDPQNLSTLLNIFKMLAESKDIIDTDILNLLK